MSRTAPAVFGGDKYLLSKVALESFKESLGNLRVKMWVLLDKSPESYNQLFKDLWPAEDLVLEHHPGIGNRGTFLRQFQVAAEQEFSDLVYLAEDDYVYHPNSFTDAVTLLREHSEVDFLTPYFHQDYVTLPMHRHHQHVINCAGRTWKSVKTTTGTFATRAKIFREAYPVFRTMLQKVFFAQMTDTAVWLSLTKYGVCNPVSWITWPIQNRFFAWSLFTAWWLAWRQILFGKKYRLWVTDPSLCTHLAVGLLAPGWDWDKEFETRIAKVKGEPR